MTLICISHIPSFYNINKFTTLLAKNVPGKFEFLNCTFPGKKHKHAYFRLSDTTNPSIFINNCIKMGQKNKVKLTARVVDHIPDNVPMSKSLQKQKMDKKGCKIPSEKILFYTHHEILMELQSKYTGLSELSRKCDHKLFIQIAKTVFERLRDIMDSNTGHTLSPFLLSKAYRKLYPHFGDFQLILSTLHAIEDAAAAPRTQVSEQELSKPPLDLNDGEFPSENVKKIVSKYVTKIEQKIKDYVAGLKTDIEPESASPEELAQHRVRVQLQKIEPYMEPMLRQVMTIHFHGARKPLTSEQYVRMQIYGEPFLPTRDHIEPIMSKCQALKILRSDHICNMVMFSTRYKNYSYLMGLNGKEIGGAKLIIRPRKLQKIKLPPQLQKEWEEQLNVVYEVPEEQMEVWDE